MSRFIATVAALGLHLTASGMAAGQSFQSLGFRNFPTSVSDNGSVIVGFNDALGQGTNLQSFRWSQATGSVGLGHPAGFEGTAAQAVSGDGSTVIGTAWNANGNPGKTYVWKPTTGWQLPGPGWGLSVSFDGSLVLGGSGSWIWDATDSSFMSLGNFHGTDLSGDASTVVGSNLSGSTAIWGGAVIAPTTLVPPVVSADGTTVVGASGVNEFYVWSSDAGLEFLGNRITAGPLFGSPISVSGNGRTVVGGSNSSAFYWTEAEGLRSLADVLTEQGFDLSGWQLTVATAISADGLTIAGQGNGPSGPSGWVARLQDPNPLGDANGDGCVTPADYTIWADNFDNGVGIGGKTWQQGDWTGEGYVTGADYSIWSDHYGLGCEMTTVPEPSGLFSALAAICALGIGLRNGVESNRALRILGCD